MKVKARYSVLVLFISFLLIGCEVSDRNNYLFSESNGEITILSFSRKGNPDEPIHNLPSRIGFKRVTAIGNGAFKYARTQSLVIPNSVRSIGNYAFMENRRLVNVAIPDSVVTIGELAFSDCHSLTSISIPDSVNSLGDYAFSDCPILVSVEITRSIETIGECVFLRCKSLKSIDLPDVVSEIDKMAFYSCESLTSVFIPESVTTIGYRAFFGCTNLDSIYMSNPTPPEIDIEAFSKNGHGRKIFVPVGSVESYKKAEGWSTYSEDITSL